MSTKQFTAAVEAYRAWDKAIDRYLSDPAAGEFDPSERAAHAAFTKAFDALCVSKGVYDVPACRVGQQRVWDQVAAAAEVEA